MVKKATDRQIDALTLQFKHMLWVSNDVPEMPKAFHNAVAQAVKALYKAMEIFDKPRRKVG